MKINNEHPLTTVNNTVNTPAVKKDISDATGNKAINIGIDRIELSTNSKDIVQIKKDMKEAPDLGSDKAAHLKDQISSGTYQVDGKAVAAKLLQSWGELNNK
jgi:flagellar biosynthesis anti-sigma factor FlgM